MVVTRGGAGREPHQDAAVPKPSAEKKVVVKIAAGKRRTGRLKELRTAKRVVRAESTTNEAANQEIADQLAAEQEAAMQAENASSSSDDSIGIPPTPRHGRQARPDPYDVPATLRPSPEKRLAAQQAARKRSASEMDPGNSPSAGAKRRRQVSGTSVAKGGKPSASGGRVDPGVLIALNQGARRLQGDHQKPALVVELSGQKRGDGSRPRDVRGEAPTSAQPVPREERQDHNDEDEPQAEVEDEPQEDEEEETVQPQEPQESTDHTDGPGIQDDEEELPGFRFEPPTPKPKPKPKTTRRTNPRKPKTAFEDRPAVTQAVPGPSRTRSSTPAQRMESVNEDDDNTTSGHLRQLFQNDQPSPVRRPINSPRPNIFDSSEEEDESDGEGEGRPTYGHLIEISVQRVKSLVSNMGLKAWTGLGKHWFKVMLNHTPFDQPNNPVVLQCCEELVALRREFSKAPRAPRLQKQDRFLRDKSQFVIPTTAKILANVDELCRQLVEEQDDGKRKALESDVCEYIIPLLVLLLRHFCLLGGAIKDNRGQTQLPENRAYSTFTTSTTQLLAHVTDWLLCVYTSLSHNIYTELEAWNEGRRPGMSQAEVDEGLKRMASELGKAIAEFRAKVQQALEDLEYKRMEPIRRAQIKKREAEILREREQVEQARAELRQTKLEALCRGTQELANKPNPMSERWHKAVALDEKRAAKRAAERQQRALSQARRPAQSASSAVYTGSPQLGGDMSALRHRSINHSRVQPIPMRRHPSRVHEAEPVTDPSTSTREWEQHEYEFILEQLEGLNGDPVRPGQYEIWAGIFGRSVAEIKKEAEALKGRERRHARQEGRPIPAWAEKR